MEKFRFWLVVTALLSATTFVVAQTELMDDVNAVKENSDEDLYAPDDEEAGSTSAAPSSAATKQAQTPVKTKANSSAPDLEDTKLNSLEELPVAAEAGGARPDSALTGSDGRPAELSAIRIYSLSDRIRFEIQTSKVVDYDSESGGANKQFTINLANTNLGPLVSQGPINAEEYGGPVSKVQAYAAKSNSVSNAKIVMNLTSKAEPVVRREGNRILVDFYSGPSETTLVKANNKKVAPAQYSRKQIPLDTPKDLPSDFETLISLNGKQNFIGTKVNFRAKDASIPDVLQFLSQVSGKNFVLVGETDKKISMNVKSVPWDQVLALVLLNAELGYQKMGATYRVMPVTKIRQEIADSIKAQEDEDKLSPKATQLFPLSYAKTSEVIPQISKYLKTEYSENVVSDDRTNSIVVTALPKNIQRIRRYIEAIDRQTPVVQIEARIVQANKDFTRELGLEWKALAGIRFAGGDIFTGAGLGGSAASTSSSGSSTSSGSGSNSSFANLGATGGAFGSYTNATSTLRQLDLFLKFNESKGITKELLRPSLTVLNNKKASIVDGIEATLILQSGQGDDSGTTKTVKAALGLTVTPQVTNDNNILLNLELTRDSIANIELSAKAVAVAKKAINTETLVESGATVVIGGVYTKEDTTAEAGWPFLRHIPILGRLFTSQDFKKESERELLMFISPRILNKERASVVQQTLEEAR